MGIKTVLTILLLLLVVVPQANAAGGIISVNPRSGDFLIGEKFQAQIRIDGGGTRFNAAKANVGVSENLTIENVILGDCGFAFVDTPSTSSPSFAGVILGGSSLSCTAFTLNLKVNGSNNGYVYVTDGSLKSLDGAREILENVENSSYSFPTSSTASTVEQVSPTQQPLVSTNGDKMYTLIYTIAADKVGNAADLIVVLDADLPTQTTTEVRQSPIDPEVYEAIFDNIPGGVHTVDVLSGSEKVSSEIVNVEGDNREISLGVSPKPAASSLLGWLLLAVGLVTAISASVLGYIFYKRKFRNNP